MAEKKYIPAIRFKGFSDQWKEWALGDEVAEIVGGGTPNTFESLYWNGEIDWYSPTEIGTNIYVNGSVKKITELGLQNSSAKLLPAEKTILFTSRAGIGNMAILELPGATNQGFQSLVLKEGFDTYFIYSMGYLIKKFADKNSSGSTFLEISGKMLGKMVIKAPLPIEQAQIGSYFQSLDKLISLHQAKVNKLVNLKKAMLEKMFPKNGADVPQIRIKGFEGAWEEKELNEICTYHTSSLSIGDAISDGKYKLYDVNSVIGYTNTNIQSCDYITIIKDGSGVGRVRLLPKNTGFIGTMGAFHPKDSDINFLLYTLLKTDFTKHVTGATIPHVYFSSYGKEKYRVPHLNEQQEIGTYFQNLDKLITLHQSELDKLNNLKKACLEQMFV